MQRVGNTTDTSQTSLRATSIIKAFSQRDVVSNVTMEVRRGEVVGLFGPNGAGKSTLMGAMTGLYSTDFGKIEIDGIDVTKLPLYARAQLGLSYLPQDASIFKGLSVQDNILLYLEALEMDKEHQLTRLEALLEEFDLVDIKRKNGSKLSGGERRRCEIARMLAVEPKYVLLDEPFSGIDPLAVVSVQQTIAKLTDRGIGVLISDHNVRETLSIVDYAYIMHSGTFLAQGTSQHIISNADVRNAYLGKTFTQ